LRVLWGQQVNTNHGCTLVDESRDNRRPNAPPVTTIDRFIRRAYDLKFP
jgi:hypothetical protein